MIQDAGGLRVFLEINNKIFHKMVEKLDVPYFICFI